VRKCASQAAYNAARSWVGNLSGVRLAPRLFQLTRAGNSCDERSARRSSRLSGSALPACPRGALRWTSLRVHAKPVIQITLRMLVLGACRRAPRICNQSRTSEISPNGTPVCAISERPRIHSEIHDPLLAVRVAGQVLAMRLAAYSKRVVDVRHRRRETTASRAPCIDRRLAAISVAARFEFGSLRSDTTLHCSANRNNDRAKEESSCRHGVSLHRRASCLNQLQTVGATRTQRARSTARSLSPVVAETQTICCANLGRIALLPSESPASLNSAVLPVEWRSSVAFGTRRQNNSFSPTMILRWHGRSYRARFGGGVDGLTLGGERQAVGAEFASLPNCLKRTSVAVGDARSQFAGP